MSFAGYEVSGTQGKRLTTRMALAEQRLDYTDEALRRIEKKVDDVNNKMDKIVSTIYNNFKWFLGISITGIIGIASLGLSIYQYVKH